MGIGLFLYDTYVYNLCEKDYRADRKFKQIHMPVMMQMYGKMYLYDIVDIKKEASSPLKTRK